MTVYIVFLFLIFIMYFFDNVINSITNTNNVKVEDDKYLFFYFTLILLTLFSAFRFNIGWDYSAYYNTIKFNTVTNIVSNGETATIMLVNLAQFYQKPLIFFFINSFITIYLIGITLKKYSVNPWVSLIFFITFPLFYLNSFSVIRLFTALAIVFYSFRYIVNRNLIKYILAVILASLFHKSAFIALIFYFVRSINISILKIIIMFLILPLTSVYINNLVIEFFPEYAVYTKETLKQEGTKAIIVMLLVAILSLIFKKKIITDQVTRVYFNVYFVGVFLYLMFLQQGTMGHRLSLYGTVFSLLLIPKLFELITFKYNSLFIKIAFYLLCIAMYFYTLIVGAETYLPYQTIFTGDR